jgi:pimeloyl-ACP methyl ester carboxylesterase
MLATTGAARTREGRSITFWAAGPNDGFPVVYCHGAIGSPRWRTPQLDELLDRLGIRYVLVNRPGFGGSDPCLGRTVADFAGDVEHVIDALGYERFSVVGVSAGAPYALACGWRLHDRLAAVAAVSPLGPAFGPGSSPSARYTVPMIPFGVPRTGPALAEFYLRALRLNGQAAARAMIDDYLVCRKDWGFQAADVRGAVAVWHGRADRLVPLAHAVKLAAAIPAAVTHVDPTGGHFFYKDRLREILGPLVAVGAEDDAALARAA